MSMVDTSSYPKPPTGSFLDTAKSYQEMEKNKIGIDQQKLGLINQQFQLVNKELTNLLNDPNATKEIAAQRLTNFANTYKLPPQVTQQMLGELQNAPNVAAFAQNAITRGMNTIEAVNFHYGVPGVHSNEQTDTPTVTSPKPGFGQRSTGLPIQRQVSPNAPVYDENNQPRLQGPTPAVVAPGTVPMPPPAPGFRLPIAPNTNLTGPDRTVTGVDVRNVPTPNQQVQNRYPAPAGPAAGQSPLFAQGLQEYTKDQSEASNRAMAIKPAAQALSLMSQPGFLSGPGTEGFTKAVAALKTWGAIETANENDPTAIRQDVNKKLADYISRSPIGQRSDAQQALKEASSPNAKVQILPALKKLTKDAIALERIQIAMPNSFKTKDYDNYVKHKGTFPQSIDERAFTIDMEDEKTKTSLIQSMAKKEQSSNATERREAAKFFKSLRMADEQGFY